MFYNINDYVWVKLSKRGIEVFNKHYEKTRNKYPALDRFLLTLPKPPEPNEHGYCKFQMYDLFQVFGSEMFLGNNNLPFETTIYVGHTFPEKL